MRITRIYTVVWMLSWPLPLMFVFLFLFFFSFFLLFLFDDMATACVAALFSFSIGGDLERLGLFLFFLFLLFSSTYFPFP